MADTNKTLVFSAAVRNFHVYQHVWNPLENEELECLFERHNVYGIFVIKTCRLEGGQIVGHFPREISRPTKFFLDRGAKVTAQLTGTHYRRSPLFQGGLEIPCLATVTIPGSIKGQRSYADSTFSANGRGTVLCSDRRSDYGKFFRTNSTD